VVVALVVEHLVEEYLVEGYLVAVVVDEAGYQIC